MQPGIYVCRDQDGLFLAQLTEDGIWYIFGITLTLPVRPEEIVAGPYTMEEIQRALATN